MKVNFDNKEFEVSENTRICDFFKEEIIDEIIAVRYNNSIVPLNYNIIKDGSIDFISRKDKEGREIYIRGLLYIMSKAITELFPEALLTINYQLTNSMYCNIDNMEITDEMVDKISKKMQEIIDKDIEIKEVQMTQEEAKEFYQVSESIKGRLQADINKEKVSLFYCEDYFNYFYGTMPISTGFAKIFKLSKFRNGLLLRYPSLAEPDKIQNDKQSLKIISAMDEYDDLYKLMKINTVHRLNKKLKNDGLKELILFSEAIHEKKIAEIASKIKERNNVRMILIAGPTSSGKTTFAGKLGMALRVQGIKPITISVDNYFVEREQNPIDENGNYDFECLEAIDIDLFNSQMLDILNGKEVNMPIFDFTTGQKVFGQKKLKLEEDQVLIIEGIHCLNDELTNQIARENKFKIYISDLTVLNIDYYNRISTTDTRLIRRISRDYKFRNYSALHTLKMWSSVNKGEQKYIFPYQDEADCMFNSSIIYELAVLKDFVIPLLEEIDDSNPEYSDAQRLIEMLRYFESIKDIDLIPNNSLLREFIGGSIYE